MKIGVISDTHNFLDPKVPELLRGVDHILHGGDVGLPWILLELEEIAPVTAVLGNTDDPGLRYRETEVIELAKRTFLVHHIVNPRQPADPLKASLTRVRPDVVVFGHTHKPFAERIGDIFFFNPGYAGQSRFGMERSVAVLHCEETRLRHEFIPL
jgi:putative phosphoesterase